MKLLLLSVFCFYAVMSFAQTSGNNPDVLRKYELLKKLSQGKVDKDSVPDKFHRYFRPYQFEVTIMSNKNKVIRLPQSNMPCVIPDTSSIAQIPNAWGNVNVPFVSQYHPIPNPGLAPKKFSFQLSNKWKE